MFYIVILYFSLGAFYFTVNLLFYYFDLSMCYLCTLGCLIYLCVTIGRLLSETLKYSMTSRHSEDFLLVVLVLLNPPTQQPNLTEHQEWIKSWKHFYYLLFTCSMEFVLRHSLILASNYWLLYVFFCDLDGSSFAYCYMTYLYCFFKRSLEDWRPMREAVQIYWPS